MTDQKVGKNQIDMWLKFGIKSAENLKNGLWLIEKMQPTACDFALPKAF